MFTVVDIGGILFAAVLMVPVLVLPGYALARLIGLCGFQDAGPDRRVVLGLLAAYGVLPVATTNLATVAGLKATLVATLGLGWLGAVWLLRDGWPRLTRSTALIGFAWLGLVVVTWVDVAFDGRLQMSLISIDMTKHAAITRTMVESGHVPPADPFFLRDGPVSFYYFYFVASALAEILAAGLIDSRAAVGGQIVWTGVALVGLFHVLYEQAGFKQSARTPALPLLLLFGSAAGLQIVTMTALWLQGGPMPGQSNWNNEMVSGWLVSLLWVPHHVAGAIASFVALMLLTDTDARRATLSRSAICLRVVAAGAALASAAGLSVWVTVGAMLTWALWSLLLVNEKRWPTLLLVVSAGAVSLILAAPFLIDISVGRAGSGAPFAMDIRGFAFADVALNALEQAGWSVPVPARRLVRLLCLPLNYLLEMGVVAVGALYFWRHTKRVDAHATEMGRLLTLSAIAAVLVGSFARSAVFNNDLGWRVLLLAQVPVVLWSTHVCLPFWQTMRGPVGTVGRLGRMPRPMAALLLLGYAGAAYDVIGIRFHGPLGLTLPEADQQRPDVDYALRDAFTWLNENVGHREVVQQNPTVVRGYAFALYGRMRVAVADWHAGQLLGADAGIVRQRIDDIAPIFNGGVSAQEAAIIARRQGIDVLVVTSADPVWAVRPSWLIGTQVMFRSPNVVVIKVSALP